MRNFQKKDPQGLFLYVPVQEGYPTGLVLEPQFQLGAVLRAPIPQVVVQLLRSGNAGVPPRAAQPSQPPPTATGPIDTSSTLQKKPKILQFLSSFFTARPSQEDLIKKKVLQGEVHSEMVCPLRYDVVAKCIAFIERHGMQAEGIYRISGNNTEVREVCRSFASTEFQLPDNMPVHTVSGALKLYLRELNPPVIPFDFYQTFMATQGNFLSSPDPDHILQQPIYNVRMTQFLP